ncbi:MAG TPA: antitoxin Xre/MbcA/ParS toxin-binding domain-containing protein [Gemmataceae bacterium]
MTEADIHLPEQVGHSYGLDLDLLAAALGVRKNVLTDWPEKADPPVRERFEKLRALLEGLAGVMRREFIAAWLRRPNEAAGGRFPLELLGAGEYAAVEEMVYRFEAGEPY